MISRSLFFFLASTTFLCAPALAEDPPVASGQESPAPEAKQHSKASAKASQNRDPGVWQLRPMNAKQFKNAWPYLSKSMASIHHLTEDEVETMRKEGEKQTGTGRPIVMTLPERVAQKRREAMKQ